MRGAARNACAPGEWYGSRSADDRSVSSPTSAHREGLCRQDWRGRGDQSVGADRDGYRSRDYCAGHDPRYLSGRSPLYRLEEFLAHQDTALLLGQALAPDAFNDDTAGRVLDRLYDVGTMKIFTACAVRADQTYGLDKQYVHFDTTSISVYGDYLPPEGQPDQQAQAIPFTITHGYSKDKRPDLKQFVFSTLCVDRAVPLWGKPE